MLEELVEAESRLLDEVGALWDGWRRRPTGQAPDCAEQWKQIRVLRCVREHGLTPELAYNSPKMLGLLANALGVHPNDLLVWTKAKPRDASEDGLVSFDRMMRSTQKAA